MYDAARELVNVLKEKKLSISAAESCTGGLFAAAIVSVPGASDVFNESYVTYSNEAKMKNIGVRGETLKEHGAVSEQTAKEMAAGCARASGAELAVSITGIAGPDGGSPKKPVGLVYTGCALCGRVFVEKNIFKGDREQVRNAAAKQALEFALEIVRRN